MDIAPRPTALFFLTRVQQNRKNEATTFDPYCFAVCGFNQSGKPGKAGKQGFFLNLCCSQVVVSVLKYHASSKQLLNFAIKTHTAEQRYFNRFLSLQV